MDQRKVIAIRLVPTSYKPKCNNLDQLASHPIIGTVFVDIEGLSILRFRVRMGDVKTPTKFCFLNSAGWPINHLWESDIQITSCVESNVVTIWKQPEDKKIGIKVFKGYVIGFIEVDIGNELKHVRRQIMSELQSFGWLAKPEIKLPHLMELVGYIYELRDKFEENETFIFLEAHNWPLTKAQEDRMTLWDIDVSSFITIQKVQLSDVVKSSKIKEEPSKPPGELSFKDLKILVSFSPHDGKIYAVPLVKSLNSLGLNGVFIGRDHSLEKNMMEKLTLNVNTSAIIIPLVTRHYTEDEYSNREFTLAKNKKKFIIPISFVENWIFDVITQPFESQVPYIEWKIFKDFNGEYYKEPDWTWNEESIQRVSKLIVEAIVNYFK